MPRLLQARKLAVCQAFTAQFLRPILSIHMIYRGSSNQSRIPNDIATQWSTSPQASRLWGADCLLPGYLCLLGWILRRPEKRLCKYFPPVPSRYRRQRPLGNGRTFSATRKRSTLMSILSGLFRDSRQQTQMLKTKFVS